MESQIATLIRQIAQWGRDRNLTDPLNVKNQFNKLVSEFGEISNALIDNDEDEVMDGIGDSIVVCIILGEQLGRPIVESDLNVSDDKACTLFQGMATLGFLADHIAKNQTGEAQARNVLMANNVAGFAKLDGYSLVDCLSRAYNEIKDRKGVLYNGVFIKESDPRYESAKAELVARQLGQDSANQLNRPPEQ